VTLKKAEEAGVLVRVSHNVEEGFTSERGKS
jgi:hypothetical protein